MKNRLGNEERKFAHIIWREEPLTSRQLIELANAELGWKKTTSYTVLKRLQEKGIFINEKGTVRALISKDEYYSKESSAYIEEAYGGSLPAFIAAFASSAALSEKDIEKLNQLINEAEKRLKKE